MAKTNYQLPIKNRNDIKTTKEKLLELGVKNFHSGKDRFNNYYIRFTITSDLVYGKVISKFPEIIKI